MREIEVLFRVAEPLAAVLKKLQHYESHGTEKIVDVYLTHPGIPELAPAGHEILTSLRVREKLSGAVLTWKRNHVRDGKYLYADEEEVAVETAEKALALLKSLGFQELVRIENERATFSAGEYEIVVDNVSGLGVLLEVEHKAPGHRAAEEVLEEMHVFLHTIGIKLGEELGLGKPELMLQKMGK